ncbi:MAG: glycosyltransferase family 8 protein [Lactobacillus sp.]|jgi:lipopolysaccharide biosynthesis glycosyltransferase|nr:glycosyltransferase family 8 protein [Lactobacillus sp.]MCI2032544.1 glycosyltransferase family 8 protein [Lactobacillus sp.]
MDLLVTIDQNYLQPLETMLTSLHDNDPAPYHLWVLHQQLTAAQVATLTTTTQQWGWQCTAIRVPADRFTTPKTTKRYPQEMYFRLLCGDLLPATVKKVLYLDPDTLVLRPLSALWRKPLHEHLFAAAAHTGLTTIATDINRLRLNQDHAYYNSGVLVINVALARQVITQEALNAALIRYERQLLLPDQDLLNLLYGQQTLRLNEMHWNYDARKYLGYLTRSRGRYDLQWVLAHTRVLHFCGQAKPWLPGHDTRFTALYLLYQRKAQILFNH